MNNKVNGNKHSKKKYIIVIILLLILLIGGTYAWLTIEITGDKINKIKAGKLELFLNETSEGITIQNAVPMTDQDGNNMTEGYSFTLKNTGNIGSDYIIYLDDLDISDSSKRMDDKYVKYSLTKNGGITNIKLLNTTGKNPNRILDSGTISADTTNTYTLKLWIDSAATNEVMETELLTQLRIVATQPTTNDNIIGAYEFNSDSGGFNYCVTGEESTCKKVKCYEPKDANSCSPGTIIKYRINDNETRYFNVLHDDGVKMTLQQRENTIYNVTWNNEGSSSSGPTNALSQIEAVTNNWSNVNSETYKMGETVFHKNAYTGCVSHTNCSNMVYQLDSKTVKARMITMQEAIQLGCSNIYGSCPIWMNNYLSNCNSSYCTYPDTNRNNNFGYWTMSALQNDTNNVSAWHINNNGSLEYHNVTDSSYGVRAVVTINK